MNYFNNQEKNKAARRINNIHFVGIGGSGMSGIAEVLHNLDFIVTGSDISKNDATVRLSELGINITYAHIAENVAYCDAVVSSSAIDSNNIELVVAKKRRIPIIHRVEMLAELMRFKYGIAVAGSHGKTTTTSLIATILAEANYDPTFVVGGRLNKFSSSAKLGASEFFVAESDESDGSFLRLNPLLAVITNIDHDHLSNYADNFDNLKKAFLDFMHGLPFYGLLIACKDDPVVNTVIQDTSRSILTYGFAIDADVRALHYTQHENVSYFDIKLPGENNNQQIILNLPGKHNVLNALAAIAVALELNIDLEIIKKALEYFQGTDRRFQIYGNFLINNKKILLIDDYGHHPKEMQAVITAVRSGWPQKRLIMVFRPHRYSRTSKLLLDFIQVLSYVDQVILLDIYGASEKNIFGVSSEQLCTEINKQHSNKAIWIPEQNNLEEALLHCLSGIVKPDDIVLMQGAGDVGKLTKQLVSKLQLCKQEVNA